MKYQFLPHYFKFIGLGLFVSTGLLQWANAFINGFNGTPEGTMNLEVHRIFFSSTFYILGYVGMILYALSKDKVFDELMIKIRHESMYMVFFGSLIFILIGLIINIDWKMSASYIIEAQMICFLIINKVRKYLILA